jgi:hypothetical protein
MWEPPDALAPEELEPVSLLGEQTGSVLSADESLLSPPLPAPAGPCEDKPKKDKKDKKDKKYKETNGPTTCAVKAPVTKLLFADTLECITSHSLYDPSVR